MYFFSRHFLGDTSFESAGLFTSGDNWIHPSRSLPSYELLVSVKGSFSLEVGNFHRELNPGKILFLPPGIPHSGICPSNSSVSFFWFHFCTDELSFISSPENLSRKYLQSDPEQLLVLPEYSDRLNVNNLYSMCSHLIHINQMKASHRYLNNYTNSILYEISQQTTEYLQGQLDPGELQPLQEWIRIHACEQITLKGIAAEFSYNPSYLSRKYQNVMGISIREQISRFRIEQAKRLLTCSSLSVQEIACEVGYNDPKYFMRVFKRFEQNTPSEYRHTFFLRHLNNT